MPDPRPMTEERATGRFGLRVILLVGIIFGGLMFWVGPQWWVLYMIGSLVLIAVRTGQDAKLIVEDPEEK